MPEACKRVGVGKENKTWQVKTSTRELTCAAYTSNVVNTRTSLQVLAHRVDADGGEVWEALFTDTSKGNNAGEYIVSLKGGGYAIYVDATSWGSQETGGNFGLIVLESDTEKELNE